MPVRKRDPRYPSKVLIDIHWHCCHICRVFYVQATRGVRLPELMMIWKAEKWRVGIIIMEIVKKTEI